MLENTCRMLLVGALGLAVGACTGGSTAPSGPQEETEITSPASGLKVSALISAGTLGDNCSGGGYCQANVQIAFNAGAGSKNAIIEIVSVTLIDAATEGVLDTLVVSSATVWNGNGYAPWNQQMPPGGDLKASYNLTAPNWSKIEGGDTGARSSSYGKNFKLRVLLRIDGIELLLESTNLNRQPQAVT